MSHPKKKAHYFYSLFRLFMAKTHKVVVDNFSYLLLEKGKAK